MKLDPKPDFYLASASPARAAMLRAAGLHIHAEPSGVDEEAVKADALQEGEKPADLAIILAQMKARAVSLRYDRVPVIGADQILVFNGEIYDKPSNEQRLRAHLKTLRGGQHQLISAVAVMQQGHLFWAWNETAHLTMRPFSDAFLEDYIARDGPACVSCVGGYRLEGLGVQLFDRIEGDYFTILGLPLLPLLGYLRQAELLAV